MAAPSPHQEGIHQLEELIYPDLHKYIAPDSRAAQAAWGVFFNIVHQVRAVLTLHRDGVCYSASPNRRTLVEYILFLAWLADDGDEVVDVLNRKLMTEQKLMSTRLRAEGMLDRFPEAAVEQLVETAQVSLEPHKDERLLKATNLIKKYDSRLTSYYAAESRFSHVSMTSIQCFAQFGQDSVTLSQMPVPEEPMPCVELCLHLLSQAMLAFNELLIGQPWSDELIRITSEYSLDNTRPTARQEST